MERQALRHVCTVAFFAVLLRRCGWSTRFNPIAKIFCQTCGQMIFCTNERDFCAWECLGKRQPDG